MSSNPALADDGQHKCDNCGKVWEAEQLKDICDLTERLTPGYPTPSGECPECHALCYPVEEEKEGQKPDMIEMTHALSESLKLQSHYARLLNDHDGGARVGFGSVTAWLDRLRELKTSKPEDSEERRD